MKQISGQDIPKLVLKNGGVPNYTTISTFSRWFSRGSHDREMRVFAAHGLVPVFLIVFYPPEIDIGGICYWIIVYCLPAK